MGVRLGLVTLGIVLVALAATLQTPIAQNFPNCAMGVNREPCALGGVWSCPSATTHHFFCLKSLML